MDEEYCKKHAIYKTRVVYGLFTLSLAEGLAYKIGLFDGTRAMTMGWNMVKFRKPVFIGDTLHLEFEAIAKRDSKSRPEFGVVTMLYRMKNQRDEVVLEAEHQLLVPKKH